MHAGRDVAKRIIGDANRLDGSLLQSQEALKMTGKLGIQAMESGCRKLAEEAGLSMSDVPEPLMKTMGQARTNCAQERVDVIDVLLEPFHAAMTEA